MKARHPTGRPQWLINVVDGVDTDQHRLRSRTHRLTEAQVREIRGLATTGVTQTALAKQFGVSQTTVSKIIQRYTWRWLEDSCMTRPLTSHPLLADDPDDVRQHEPDEELAERPAGGHRGAQLLDGEVQSCAVDAEVDAGATVPASASPQPQDVEGGQGETITRPPQPYFARPPSATLSRGIQ